MASQDFLSDHHIVPAFVPVADAFAGGITSEAVSLASYRRATLVVVTGAIEDSGISNLITLEACTAAAGTGNTAVAFAYRVQRYSTTVDTWSAFALATSSGYNFAVNNAVANAVWVAEVTAEQLCQAVDGAEFVRAVIAETANKTITAGGIWILSEPRYCNSVPVQAIA
jgi:phosphoribosylformimino-5-aminoimidazole carboxamide ribonucleotide (ProFAR) isomerase